MENNTDHRWVRPAYISEEHQRELYQESGISPEVAAERGYYAASTAAEVPPEFKRYQRRPGLVVPMYSPDGETISYQVKPYRPRRDKAGKEIKYETPGGADLIADVHPQNARAIRDASVPLIITEGIKTADAMTSRGLCVVALPGVWNFRRRKSAEMIPCFDHMALEGRLVRIVFDSDVMTKPEVQLALSRLKSDLEDRGARVQVVYLPDASDGSKQGADDYLAAGGTVEELESMARTFDLVDLGEVRLSRDAQLRAVVEDVRRRWWDYAWRGMRRHSARDVLKVLIDAGEHRGKLTPEGLRVVMASRTLALKAAISRPSLSKALDALEVDGWIRRDNEGRERSKPGAVILLSNYASLYHYGEKRQPGTGGEGRPLPAVSREYDHGGKPLRSSAPRLRWSSPGYKPRRGTASGTRRVRTGPTPEPRPAIKRLGKIAGAALEVLARLGGDTTVRDLADRLGRGNRPSEFRRRQLSRLEVAGIVSMEGDRITLTPGWGDRVEDARRLAREVDYVEPTTGRTIKGAATLQAERYERQREAFHRRDEIKPDPTPEMRDMKVINLNRERERRKREGQRSPLAQALAAFLDLNPSAATQRPGWLGSTLWAQDLYPEKVTPAETREALEELGGDTYRRSLLERSRDPVRRGPESPAEASPPVPTPTPAPATPAPEEPGHNGTELKTEPVPTTEPDLEPPPIQRARRLTYEEVLQVKALMAGGVSPGDARSVVLAQATEGE